MGVLNFNDQVLSQSSPTVTTASSLYSPSSPARYAIVKQLIVCNTSSSSADYSVFLNQTTTTFDNSSAVVRDATIAANSYVTLGPFPINNSAANLGIQTGNASAITFTVIGEEK